MAKTAKDEARDVMQRLPDDVPMEKLLYELHVHAKAMRGVGQLDAGQSRSHEEVMERLDRWLKSAGL
jgi:hypothetical protein